MNKNNKEQCWNCGSRVMQDKGSYVQCGNCLATWNYVPVLAADPLSPNGFYLKDANGTVLGRMRKLSKSVSRAAAKARRQKSEPNMTR